MWPCPFGWGPQGLPAGTWYARRLLDSSARSLRRSPAPPPLLPALPPCSGCADAAVLGLHKRQVSAHCRHSPATPCAYASAQLAWCRGGAVSEGAPPREDRLSQGRHFARRAHLPPQLPSCHPLGCHFPALSCLLFYAYVNGRVTPDGCVCGSVQGCRAVGWQSVCAGRVYALGSRACTELPAQLSSLLATHFAPELGTAWLAP